VPLVYFGKTYIFVCTHMCSVQRLKNNGLSGVHICVCVCVCGVWCVVCGVCCVVRGVWCVVCDVWCVVCGVWCVCAVTPFHALHLHGCNHVA
jgi:hypothetical protein